MNIIKLNRATIFNMYWFISVLQKRYPGTGLFFQYHMLMMLTCTHTHIYQIIYNEDLQIYIYINICKTS